MLTHDNFSSHWLRNLKKYILQCQVHVDHLFIIIISWEWDWDLSWLLKTFSALLLCILTGDLNEITPISSLLINMISFVVCRLTFQKWIVKITKQSWICQCSFSCKHFYSVILPVCDIVSRQKKRVNSWLPSLYLQNTGITSYIK